MDFQPDFQTWSFLVFFFLFRFSNMNCPSFDLWNTLVKIIHSYLTNCSLREKVMPVDKIRSRFDPSQGLFLWTVLKDTPIISVNCLPSINSRIVDQCLCHLSVRWFCAQQDVRPPHTLRCKNRMTRRERCFLLLRNLEICISKWWTLADNRQQSIHMTHSYLNSFSCLYKAFLKR